MYPLFALASYIICEYRTKTVNGFVRYSQTLSHKGVQVGYIIIRPFYEIAFILILIVLKTLRVLPLHHGK